LILFDFGGTEGGNRAPRYLLGKERKSRKEIAASVNADGEGTVRGGEDAAKSGVNFYEGMEDLAVCLCDTRSILWLVEIFYFIA
jgi:hypothetical protein